MRISLLFLLATLLLPACIVHDGHDDLVGDEAERARLETQILDLIGDAPATAASQCQAIAFGSKPCGGPWRYLVYSTAHTDSARLGALVEQYNALDEKINIAKGMGSDCAFISRPTIVLNGGRCEVGR